VGDYGDAVVVRLVLDFLAAEGPTMTFMPLRRG
jgi:hypothetical protein